MDFGDSQMTFSQQVISEMIMDGIIPSGIFPITQKLIYEFICRGLDLRNPGSFLFIQDSKLQNKVKHAALRLIQLNVERGLKSTDVDYGFVYMISNPSFPDHVKIGMTMDVNTRLRQYQTYDPFRQFKVEHYKFVLNRREMERQILDHPEVFSENGEWVKRENAKHIFLQMTRWNKNYFDYFSEERERLLRSMNKAQAYNKMYG